MSETSTRFALYPGSFDILTYGHVDLIRRGRELFDRLIVAVATNPSKNPTFSVAERLALLRQVTGEWPNVECVSFGGLTVDFARKANARFIVRGLRAVSDFDFELQFAITNQQLNREVETIFLAPAPEFIFLSSSIVREVWTLGGDVSRFVPPAVARALKDKEARR